MVLRPCSVEWEYSFTILPITWSHAIINSNHFTHCYASNPALDNAHETHLTVGSSVKTRNASLVF